MRSLLLCVLCLALPSCAHRSRRGRAFATEPLQPVQMAYARLGDATERDFLPSELDPAVVRDEARLIVNGAQTCVQLLMRTPRGFDEPLEMRQLDCWFDGDELPAVVREQAPPQQKDYPFTSAPPQLEIAGRHGWFSIPIGPGQPRVFHVVEREAMLCCPGSGETEAELVVKSEYNSGSGFYKLGFKWPLAPVAAVSP